MGQVGGPRRARQAEHAKDRNENMFEFLHIYLRHSQAYANKDGRIFKAFATGIFPLFDRFILVAIVVKNIPLYMCRSSISNRLRLSE